MRRSFVLALLVLVMGSPLACNETQEAILAAVGGGCLLDSDCEAGLVCLFRSCHQPCETSEDCPFRDDGERQPCVIAEKPIRVCQLEDETACVRHSDCPGSLVCALDARCRSACGGDRDCAQDQVCVSGTCADQDDLDDNGVIVLSDESPREGAVCIYHSDCPPGADGQQLRCRDGFCEAGCLGDDRDCGRFELCSTAGSDPPQPGECELIGDPASLFCSPKDDHPHEQTIACACPDGSMGEQTCNADGASYGPCTVGMTTCELP